MLVLYEECFLLDQNPFFVSELQKIKNSQAREKKKKNRQRTNENV